MGATRDTSNHSLFNCFCIIFTAVTTCSYVQVSILFYIFLGFFLLCGLTMLAGDDTWGGWSRGDHLGAQTDNYGLAGY